ATASDNFHIVSDIASGQRGLRFYLGDYGNGTPLATLTPSGKLGIAGAAATTSPLAYLHVNVTQTVNPTRPTGTWAGFLENLIDSSGNNGLSVATRWGNTGSTIFEAATYWNGSTEMYVPILSVN